MGPTRPGMGRWLDRFLTPFLALLNKSVGRPSEADLASLTGRSRGGPDVARAPTSLEAGRRELAEGRYAEALEQSDAALRLDPSSVGALVNRGAALDGLGRTEEALVATKAALTRDPTSEGALRNLSRMHREADAWDDEHRALETLRTVRPSDAEVRLLLARNRANAGDP